MDIARRIVNSRNGELRASKPKVQEQVKVADDSIYGYTYRHLTPEAQGDAAYVWRMVAFMVSQNRQHQCMPVTAEFDLGGTYTERMSRAKTLDALVDKIVKIVPMRECHGALRWGKALGMI